MMVGGQDCFAFVRLSLATMVEIEVQPQGAIARRNSG